MLYINNPLLSAEGIIAELQKETQNASKRKGSGPAPIEIIRRKLKALFSLTEISNEEMVTSIIPQYFAKFPRYQDILTQIFSEQTTPTLHEALQDGVSANFSTINNDLNFFPTVTPEIEALFQMLDQRCQKIMALERQAYSPDMAYKLMVLFYDPRLSVVDNFAYISQQFVQLYKGLSETRYPYHHALITEFNRFPSADLTNIEAWKRFVSEHGVRAIKYFCDADRIEAIPASLKAAEALALHHRYARAKENLSFANLCKKHRIDEDTFNSALDFMASGWPKKEGDSLPVVDIADTNHEYFWVKLSPHDPRALFLGNITNCCQHMSGHSEQCVKDGASLAHNGFYVLLKAKGVPCTEPRLVEGQVNEEHYAIVGQSYAWRSIHHNLCLDSIEAREHQIPPVKLQEMMGKFSESVFQSHPEIKYITVGQGGQTPRGLWPATSFPEKIRSGYQYGDSSHQQVVATSSSKALPHPCFSYIYPYLTAEMQADFPQNLLAIDKDAENKLPVKMSMLLSFAQDLKLSNFSPLSLEQFLEMSPTEQASVSSMQKIWNMTSIEDAVAWWAHLNEAEKATVFKFFSIENDSFFNRLVQTQSISTVRQVFATIPEIDLISKIKGDSEGEQLSGLFASASNAEIFALCLSKLSDDEVISILKRSRSNQTEIQLLPLNPDMITILYRRLGQDRFIDLMTFNTNNHSNQASALDKIIANPILLNRLMVLEKNQAWIITGEQEQKAMIQAQREALQTEIDALEEQQDQKGRTKVEQRRISDEIRVLERQKRNLTTKPYYPLHAAAKNPESFKILLACYPTLEAKKAALEHMNQNKENILSIAAEHPGSLQMILAIYQDDIAHFKELLCHRSLNNYCGIDKAMINPESFAIILQQFPDIYQKIEPHSWQRLMEYPASLSMMMASIPDISTYLTNLVLGNAMYYPESLEQLLTIDGMKERIIASGAYKSIRDSKTIDLLFQNCDLSEINQILCQKIDFRQSYLSEMITGSYHFELLHHIYRKYYLSNPAEFIKLILYESRNFQQIFQNTALFNMLFDEVLQTNTQRLDFLLSIPNCLSYPNLNLEKILQTFSVAEMLILLRNHKSWIDNDDSWQQIFQKFHDTPEPFIELLQLTYTQEYGFKNEDLTVLNAIGMENERLFAIIQSSIGAEKLQQMIQKMKDIP